MYIKSDKNTGVLLYKIIFVLAALAGGHLCSPPIAAGQSRSDLFIDSLMAKMTLEEKIGQLNLSVISGGAVTGSDFSSDINKKIAAGNMGGVFGIWNPDEMKKMQKLAVEGSRLHIPLLFGLDVIHGHKTVFPVPLALSASWDTALIRQLARTSAVEASNDGVNWVYSPMVDIARDPRWGRVVEGAGEDPFLGSEIAKAMVKGYQGDDLSLANTVMACVKHFAVYGAPAAGREYNSVDMSLQGMYQYYLPPYKAAVDAGVGSVMTSFNDLNGLPSTGNEWLLTDLLRNQWKFKGMVVSDYGSVGELAVHGLGTPAQVAALALRAGTDMEMVGDLYLNTLKQSVEQGLVATHEIDEACRYILSAKYKLGLFDDPYLYFNIPQDEEKAQVEAHRKFARKVAAQTFVLLKNDNQILPLQKKGTIAVIGPLAESRENMLGAWNIAGDPNGAVTVLEGIKNAVGSRARILYQKGADITDDSLLKKRVNVFKKEISTDSRTPRQMIKDAVDAAQKSDVVVAVVGEAADMTGESASRAFIDIPASQRQLLKALKNTGKPVILVLFNGRPLVLNWEKEHCEAILDVWFGGSEAGNAVADVLFGDYNPSGKLSMSFPRSIGQIPVYYNQKRTGRPFNDSPDEGSKFKSDYLDEENSPLFPFGYGLSFTQFSYGKVDLSQSELKGEDTLIASIRVTNTGKFSGEETVQLYITDPIARITRSVQDLKGFRKVNLEPGETKEVSFKVTTDLLKYYDYDLKNDWDAGKFIIRIGGNSADTQSAEVQWNK